MDSRYSMGSIDTSALWDIQAEEAPSFDWGSVTADMFFSTTQILSRAPSEPCTRVPGGRKAYVRREVLRSANSPYMRATKQLEGEGCTKTGQAMRKYTRCTQPRCQGCPPQCSSHEMGHDVYCCPPVAATIKPPIFFTPPEIRPPITCPTNCSPRWTAGMGVGRWTCDCAPYGPPPVPPVPVPGQGQQMVQGYRPPWRPTPWMALAVGVVGGFAAVTLWNRR